MKLSDLQNKTIVNISDGKNIGNIIDIKIDEKTGTVLGLIIEPTKSGLFSFGNKGIDTEIQWRSIAKIGEDVILVNIAL